MEKEMGALEAILLMPVLFIVAIEGERIFANMLNSVRITGIAADLIAGSFVTFVLVSLVKKLRT